jgi:hypothetical protein
MITKLVAELRAAKMAEETAKKNRLDVENKILALYATPDGGEGTHNDEEFSIAWKLTRTVDAEALSAVFETIRNSERLICSISNPSPRPAVFVRPKSV